MNKPRQNQGFTIIETLVAIAVLMIAIAGPLSIANKGLVGALASRDQMIASFLAQESFEVVKNIRDTNKDNSVNWIDGNTFFPTMSSCTSSNPCDASAIDSSTILSCGTLAACKSTPLHLAPGNFYTHTNSGSITPFVRYFYLSQPNLPANACSSISPECTVTVVVEWNEGIMPYSIKIANEIANTYR